MWREIEQLEGAYIFVNAHGSKAGRARLLITTSQYFESEEHFHLHGGS